MQTGDDVVVQSLTFGATAFAVTYVGARPVLLDSEAESGNLSPDLLAELLATGRMLGETPERVPFTDLYDAGTAKRPWAFQARPVVGGVYARLLTE